MTQNLLFILLTAILTNNYILVQFLGICPFLGVSRKTETAAGMGIAVTVVMVIATAVVHPINQHILEANDLIYLQTIVFILIIAALVQLLEFFLRRFIPPLYETLGIYLPLITTNCAILGVVLLNVEQSFNYPESLVNSLGAGLGFLLAMVLFSGVRERLEYSDIPKSLQGLPITLISAALVSVSFLGFAGLIERIFA